MMNFDKPVPQRPSPSPLVFASCGSAEAVDNHLFLVTVAKDGAKEADIFPRLRGKNK